MFKLSSMYIPKLWVWKVKKKGKNMEYTHFDKHGNAVMVDVSEKAVTKRVAVAKGSIRMSRECFDKIKYQDMKKGDVLGVARIAGIMGAKKTSELIPLCHILNLTSVTVDFIMQEESSSITAVCETKTTKTAACFFTLLYCASRRSVSLTIRSSYEVMAASLVAYCSERAINSSTVCTRCFCSKE